MLVRVLALWAGVTGWCGCGRSREVPRDDAGDGAEAESSDSGSYDVLAGVVQMAGGGYHFCARRDGGDVLCWGSNQYGQLGIDPTVTPLASRPTPVASLGGATDLAAGEEFTCATITDAGTSCVGLMLAFPDGGMAPSAAPFPVQGLPTASALAAGDYHACALASADAGVWCWGSNDSGQIGPNGGASSLVAVPVPLPGPVTAVAAGGSQSCALLADGTVWCWGWGFQIDNPSSKPTIWEPQRALAISIGIVHACAILEAGGSVACWGNDAYGGLGDGRGGVPVGDYSVTPVIVGNLSGVTALVSGWEHTCALLPGGTLQCWGDNTYGQLGNGTTARSLVPTPVVGVAGAMAIVAGHLATCAIFPGGRVKCWGYNLDGTLGDGTMTNSLAAVSVLN